MTKNYFSGLLDSVLAAKMKAEKKMQAFGARIRKNVEQGQKDFKSGKIKHHEAINPFK